MTEERKKMSVCLMVRGLALVILVTMALVTPLMNIGLAQTTRLYVNPRSIVDTTKTPGESFTVDINVENVADLFTWAFVLSWDPDVLNVTSVVEGPFLAEVAPEGTFFIDKRFQEAGYIDEACSILGPYPGAEGSGTLLTVTFLVEKVGETTLNLEQTQLIDSKTPPGYIDHTVTDGYFANLSPKIYVDPAENSKKPGESFTINVTAAYMPDLHNWEFWLSWNSAVLDATSVTEGDFLKSGGTTTFTSTIDSFTNATGTYGRIHATCTLTTEPFGVNGGGTLASATFTVKTVAFTPLDLYDTKAVNSDDLEIAHETLDGLFVATRIYVDPERSAKMEGESITLNITAAEVTDFYTWELSLSWNKTVLEATQAMEGPFLNSAGSTTFYNLIDNTAGSIYANCTLLSPPGVSGTGTIMNVTFLVKTKGNTTLDLHDTNLFNSAPAKIPHMAFDGSFSSIYPTVDYTLSPDPPYQINQVITFSFGPDFGCKDEDGYITSYTWNFGDGNITTVPPTKNSITHAYTLGGKYNATLFATDNDGLLGNKTRELTIKAKSTITISVSPKTITLGESATISGLIQPTKVDVDVTIYYMLKGPAQAWKILTTVKTNVASQYTYTWTPSPAGIYSFYSKWDGDETTVGTQAPEVDPTVPKASLTVLEESSISISASPTTITYNQNVTITGKITPTRDDKEVTIWYKLTAEEKWKKLTYTFTNATSQYSYLWIRPPAGIYQLKGNWTGDASTLDAESTIEQVTVNKAGSSITISITPTAQSFGENITITGSINVTRPNVSVTIWYQRPGQTWINMTAVKTNATSQYTYTWAPTAAGTFQIKANWTGDSNYNSAESDETTVTINKASSTISIDLNATTINFGESIVISGAIAPKRPNVPVVIQVIPPGQFWRTLTTVTSDQNGNYTYTYTPSNPGTYRYKANWGGDSNTLESESSQQPTLTVLEKGGEGTQGLDVNLIAFIGVVIIIVVAIVMLKIRKKPQTPQP